MKWFRIFTNDVGPNAYSCLRRQAGETADEALEKGKFRGAKCLAILDDPKELERYGPDGQTGKLPSAEILEMGRKVGYVAGPRRYGR